MKTFSALLILALTVVAQAQTSATTAIATETTSTTTVETKPEVKKASGLILGFKSTNDSFRNKNQGVSGARVLNSKNELYAGYRHPETGWGAFLNGVQYYRAYNEAAPTSKTNKYKYNANWVQSDASITFLHPDFYKSPDLTLFGQLRYYFRTTPRSRDQEIDQFAYYFRTVAKPAADNEIYNELIPRYFNSQNYLATDTTYYVEDTTIYNYKINSMVKVGFKQWSQYEVHAAAAPGFAMEAGPSARFTIGSNLTIDPAIMFPVIVETYTSGGKVASVYDGPTEAKADQAYASLRLDAKF